MHCQLWRVEANGEERKVTYLTTLIKHTQAVNVVRFCPKGGITHTKSRTSLTETGEMLASAGDDGNILLWVPSETQTHTQPLGEDSMEEKETWRVKHMCRSSGSEIYDLAWSPDGVFFITGSMDNVARIYNAQTGPFPAIVDVRYTNLLQVKWFDRLPSTVTTYKELHGIR
jgi:chromatin assembly factor 1 subunit B